MKKSILALSLLLLAGGAFAQNMASPHVRAHVKLQNDNSFESRDKSNTGFSVESAKTALASEKEKQKVARRRERENKKRDAIYARIEELKTKN